VVTGGAETKADPHGTSRDVQGRKVVLGGGDALVRRA